MDSKINSFKKNQDMIARKKKCQENYNRKSWYNENNGFIPIAEPDLGTKELEYLTEAYLSSWVSSTGEFVNKFEDEFAKYCGVKYGITTSNGTTALHLALVALGIGEGDEVIVPNITFASTANAVIYTGAKPVLVDIEKDSWCMDPIEFEAAITSKTKAVIPVHIYGQPCEMTSIMDIAERNNLYVIEDCAEAHGAEYKGKKVGSFGIISCFSFYGNKVITTGEGGMCVTDNNELNLKMRILRDHGMNKENRYYHDFVGFNYRITNLQAALGLGQLEDIETKLRWRKELEDVYFEEIERVEGLHIQRRDLADRKKVAWLVTAYIDNSEKREAVFESLKRINVDVRPFFIPLSKMKIYEKYVFSEKNSINISNRGFNLPTHRRLNRDSVSLIVNSIDKALK